jgi:type VI secretion system protein ImpK
MFRNRPPAPRGRRPTSGVRTASAEASAEETIVVGGTPPPRERATSRIDRAEGPARRPGLLGAAADWLVLILAVRRAGELADAEAVRRRVLEAKAEFERRAADASCKAADIQSASYALVAFTDAAMMRSRGPARDAWTDEPLQMRLYDHNIAGAEFFNRLDELRRDRQNRIDALEVCHACLLLGFRGRYEQEPPEKLKELLSGVESDIAAVRGTARSPLAPNAVSREVAGAKVAGIPWWISVVVFVPATLLVWLLLSGVARWVAGRAAEEIRKMAG